VAQTFKERVIEEGPWAEEGDSNIMWRKMAMCIRKIASEEFGLSQGNRREVKDTWWWNEDVQKAIKEKKDCYKRLHHDKCAENIEKYRIAKKSAKRAVSRARGQALTTFINGWTQSREKRISIGWPRFVKGRQGMSTKSNASRMKQTNY